MPSGKHSKEIRKLYKKELKEAVKKGATKVILKAISVSKFWRLMASVSFAINTVLILMLIFK